MEKGRLNILVIDEDVSNISYFTLTALGLVTGVRIHVLTTGMRRLDPLRFSRYISSYSIVKRETDDNFIENIRNHAKATNSTILMPVTEKTMKFFSSGSNELQDFAKIPAVASANILDQVTNKRSLHYWLKQHGFPVANSIAGNENTGELLNLISQMTFPVLIKPVQGSAGTGIRRFNSFGEVENYFTTTALTEWNNFIFQEYVQGSDIDISALCMNGDVLNYTIQRGINNKTLRFSTAIEFLKDTTLLSISRSIFKKLNFSGIAHLDFRLSRDTREYYLVDFNARFWSSILGSLEAGINFPLQYIKTALNEPVIPVDYQNITYYFSSAAIKSFFSLGKSNHQERVKLSHSQLKYNMKDPVPAALSLIKKISP